MANLSEENASLSTEMEVETGIDIIDEEDQNWDDWEADEEDDTLNPSLLCLFCDSSLNSDRALFQHCASSHHFDFEELKNNLCLDFYSCFKLINYIRSEVAENRCWNCRVTCKSKQEMQDHLHKMINYKGDVLPWDDDKYLKPFLQEDALLYSFVGDNEGEDDTMSVDNNELCKELSSFERIKIDDYEFPSEEYESRPGACFENGGKKVASTTDGSCNNGNHLDYSEIKNVDSKDCSLALHRNSEDKRHTSSISGIVRTDIKNINKSYFGSYSSFGIHREMISDKERTDAYRRAVLENPSLFRGSTVMDVGCGTGILSLFAAQAGASRVIAVEASEKMAAVATEVARENGLLRIVSPDRSQYTGVIEVVQGMVEELDVTKNIKPNSVDVIISEWMGYCLLYESMLSSVLMARDKWLKPGGAILPDTATMFVAGFGRGGTSIPFWENVYGLNMSCIGKELAANASHFPLVEVLDSSDLVTSTAVLQAFDLLTMKTEEMDFTSIVELELKNGTSLDNPLESTPITTWCYGLVLWFETGFTDRFCKEKPTNLSTSPYQANTHWSQTLLTFREPIAMSLGRPSCSSKLEAVGSDACPAVRIQSRISIVRAIQHRSIDISMELTAVGKDGRKRTWPGQLFHL